MAAEDYFKKEWGTGFIKATLSEKDGLLELSMNDLYETMEGYAEYKHQEEKDSPVCDMCNGTKYYHNGSWSQDCPKCKRNEIKK